MKLSFPFPLDFNPTPMFSLGPGKETLVGFLTSYSL